MTSNGVGVEYRPSLKWWIEPEIVLRIIELKPGLFWESFADNGSISGVLLSGRPNSLYAFTLLCNIFLLGKGSTSIFLKEKSIFLKVRDRPVDLRDAKASLSAPQYKCVYSVYMNVCRSLILSASISDTYTPQPLSPHIWKILWTWDLETLWTWAAGSQRGVWQCRGN